VGGGVVLLGVGIKWPLIFRRVRPGGGQQAMKCQPLPRVTCLVASRIRGGFGMVRVITGRKSFVAFDFFSHVSKLECRCRRKKRKEGRKKKIDVSI
jgi:hypothetical protein